MRKMRPQKQLLQFVMLSLLSVVSVLVTSGESFAALVCSSCHGNKATDMSMDIRPLDTPPGSPVSYRNITTGAFKGNHQTHLSATFDQTKCSKCHNNDSSYTSSHRNGLISLNKVINNSGAYSAPNLNDAGTYVFKNQTSVPTLGTCSNVNCHFERITPTWGADPRTTATDVTCGTCHDATPTSGSHSKHITQYTLALGDASLTCVKCHADRNAARPFEHATSVGRPINLANTGGTYTGSNSKYLPSQTGRVFGTCNTVYCHSSGQSSNGTSATPQYAQPQWNNPSTGMCGTCHETNNQASGSHTKHLAKYSDCGFCHSGATATTMNSANHANGFINVSGSKNVSYSQGRQSARGNGYGSCSNADCHSPSTAAPLRTPTWGTTATCDSCHQATPTTGAHSKHLHMQAVNGFCYYCHDSNAAKHVNGQVDFNANIMSTPVNKHAAGVYSATCSVTCHNPYSDTLGNTTPTWGATATCSSCHAAPPQTGSHTKHLASLLYVNCGDCHTGAVINTNGTSSGGDGHGNGKIDVANGYPASVAKHASGSGYSSCSASTCHNAYGKTAGVATPTWGNSATCNSCHAAPPATGSHADHLAHTTTVSCGSCHNGAVIDVSGGVNHIDGNVDVSVGGYPVNVPKHASGSGYNSCSNVSCHTGGNGSARFVASALTWGSTNITCESCHGFPPSSSYHSGVQPGTCNGCHSNVKPGVAVNTPLALAFVDRNVHMNGVVDGGQCNACHGYPPVASMGSGSNRLGVNGNYSSARLENYSGGGGMHSVAGHLPLTTKFSNGLGFTPCLTCHPSTSHNQGSSVFYTGNVQISVNPEYKFDKNRPIVYAKSNGAKSTGSCTNVACHFQKTPLWSTEAYTQGH